MMCCIETRQCVNEPCRPPTDNCRLIGPLTEKQIERFQSYVDRQGEDECWNWKASRSKHGYGQFVPRAGINLRSHRVAYYLGHGVEPAELKVCHKCNNRACCNPSHLFLGTQQDNLADARAKGRMKDTMPKNKGECNGRAKLTAEKVRTIRGATGTVTELSHTFGVSRMTISKVRRRELWPHVN